MLTLYFVFQFVKNLFFANVLIQFTNENKVYIHTLLIINRMFKNILFYTPIANSITVIFVCKIFFIKYLLLIGFIALSIKNSC